MKTLYPLKETQKSHYNKKKLKNKWNVQTYVKSSFKQIFIEGAQPWSSLNSKPTFFTNLYQLDYNLKISTIHRKI